MNKQVLKKSTKLIWYSVNLINATAFVDGQKASDNIGLSFWIALPGRNLSPNQVIHKALKELTKIVDRKTKKKKFIIGEGYPWYGDYYKLEYQTNLKTILPVKKTSNGLSAIQLFDNPLTGQKGSKPSEIIMLDPKGTHNGKKYRLVLEEI